MRARRHPVQKSLNFRSDWCCISQQSVVIKPQIHINGGPSNSASSAHIGHNGLRLAHLSDGCVRKPESPREKSSRSSDSKGAIAKGRSQRGDRKGAIAKEE